MRGTGRPRKRGYKLEQKASYNREKASLKDTKGEAKIVKLMYLDTSTSQ
jgi:hypothetical protein